jgi:hypothetical protein
MTSSQLTHGEPGTQYICRVFHFSNKEKKMESGRGSGETRHRSISLPHGGDLTRQGSAGLLSRVTTGLEGALALDFILWVFFSSNNPFVPFQILKRVSHCGRKFARIF